MEIKEVIYEYLDKNYPIKGNTVTVDCTCIYSFRHVHNYKMGTLNASHAAIEKWANALGSELFDKMERDNEKFINKKEDNTEKYTIIDKEIVEMFGVKWKTYFWDWTEDRIGDFVAIQFKDAKSNFNKRVRIWGDGKFRFQDMDMGVKLPPIIGPIVDVP